MIRRPPRSTLSSSSAASDVYKRQGGKYSLQTQDGTYLRADPKLFVNTASSCQDWEMWYVEAHPTIPTKAAIRSHHGTFLRADGGTVDLAVRPLEWEAWEVIPV
eukprot:TRINITY_DN16500_c0_g1_i7.p2 TRINITY_DN16500_c0_g1~~TRINITY_DN16500_c0_g1_i7.p2  ORF type:complete len:104 (+),score=16.37 TRINITY_DN16500_c0_g1_i7:99-410(+)